MYSPASKRGALPICSENSSSFTRAAPHSRHYSIKKRKPGPLIWSFGFWVLTFTGCQQFKVVWWVIMGLFIMKIVQISRGELSREINCRTEACIVARQPLFCLVFGFSAQLLLLKCSQGSRAPYFILIASFWRVMLCPWEGVLFHCLSSSYNESTKANLVFVLNFGKILHF